MLVRCVRLALPLLLASMLLILTASLVGGAQHGDVLIYVAGERANNRIYLLDLTTRVAHALTPVGAYSQPVWMPDGRLAYLLNDDGFDIYMYDFVSGTTSTLRQFVRSPSWSNSGYLAYETYQNGDNDLFLMNLTSGEVQQLTSNDAPDFDPVFSPSGHQLLFTSLRDTQQGTDVYLMDLASGETTNLSEDPAPDFAPAWSPDGTALVFTSRRAGSADIFLLNLTNGALTNLTHSADIHENDAEWSPDGTQIAFASNRDGDYDIYVMNADGSNVRQVTFNDMDDTNPAWVP